jgi:hypothetical protein
MFHTNVASVCPKCFICLKCMLHSSVSCCKCRPPASVSMGAGRAKPRPPTCGGGASRRRRCGEEAGGESSGRPRRDRRRTGMEEAGASHPSSVGSGYEAGCSDASVGNEAGAGST